MALAAGVDSASVREARVRLIAVPGPALAAGSRELVAAYAEAAGAAVESFRAPSHRAESIVPLLTGADLIVVLGAGLSG